MFIVLIGIFSRVSFVAGKIVNQMLSSVYPLSYLQLNKGDEKIIGEYCQSKSTKLMMAAIASLFGFGTSILASLIATWLSSA
jgi:hypothetical protein